MDVNCGDRYSQIKQRIGTRLAVAMSFRVTGCVYARDQFLALAAVNLASSQSPSTTSSTTTAAAAAVVIPWSVMARIGREWVTATARRVALKMTCDDDPSSPYHMVWVVVGVSHTLGVTEGPRAVDYLGPGRLVCGFMAHGSSALVCRTGLNPGLDVMVTDAAADSCGVGGVGGGRGAKGEVVVTGVELGVSDDQRKSLSLCSDLLLH
ncbi:hypothetical protein Pelo_384 [Pelomyxa schiedti]|nr:hypothetical protein Pelo_384 [Pelomyxa schiedti]